MALLGYEWYNLLLGVYSTLYTLGTNVKDYHSTVRPGQGNPGITNFQILDLTVIQCSANTFLNLNIQKL